MYQNEISRFDPSHHEVCFGKNTTHKFTRSIHVYTLKQNMVSHKTDLVIRTLVFNVILNSIGESLFTLIDSLTYAYHYLMTLITKTLNIERAPQFKFSLKI